VTVGDSAVGKTSFLLSYINRSFPAEYTPTVFDHRDCSVNLNGKTYSLELWDTSSSEEYDQIRPLSYPGTDIFVLMFSVVSPLSFRNIALKWIPELRHYNGSDVPILLVGSKMELRDDEVIREYLSDRNLKPVEYEEGRRFAEENGISYLECSAVDLTGIDEVIHQMIRISLRFKKKENSKNWKKFVQYCKIKLF